MRTIHKPLKELVELVIDYRGKTPLKLNGEWTDSGYRALSALNVKTRGLVAEDKIRFVNADLYRKWMKEEVKKGDILITSEAPFGQVFQWKTDEKIVLSQRLFALRIKSQHCSEYIYQYMASDFFYAELRARATGSTVEGLRQPELIKCKIALPDISIQRKIASILSAYDSLIENNTKRIRLLERMAENLYKEWFVRFRFPGHENTEFVDSLPKGWKYEKLFDVANISYGYAFKSDLFCNDTTLNAVVRIRDIQDNKTNTYTKERCDDKYLIDENALIIGMDGVFHMCLWNGTRAYLNQRVVKIISKDANFCNYMLLMAIRPQVKFWEQVIVGTTVAHLGDKHLRKMKVLVPEKTILIKANKQIEFIMQEKNKLFKETALLAKQRDLLLPRLMSGKLEVKA